mgnify:CR=1 FL=1
MRKLFLPFFIFSFFEVKAQETVLFKIKYLPEHKYTSSMDINNHTEMNIEADKETLEKIKSKGVQLPLIITAKTSMGYEIQTGPLDGNKSFPVTISYTGINSAQTMNGKETTSPPSPLLNLRIYAHCDKDNKMQLDSMPGKNLNDTLRTLIGSMIKNIQNQIKFPEQPLKIGDSFTQDLPMSFPVAGNNIQMVIKMIYKLSEIKNRIAYFDLIETAEVKLTIKGNNLDMIGQGDGKLIFDIAQSFAPSITSNLKCNYTMNMEKLLMKGSAAISSIHKTVIN